VIAEPDLSYEKVLETIRNTRKTINEGKADGKVMSVELPAKEGGVLDL
jgi:copper chaperone